MASVESSASASFFSERHSFLIRIWHWLFFALVATTMILVLLATQFFDTRDNSPMVMEEATGNGLEINEKQARRISHAFEDKFWELHTYVGRRASG